MALRITTAKQVLRTDTFRTQERGEYATRGVLIRYTNTVNDPRIDAAFMDTLDCAKGFFGITSHYVVRTSGTVEIGRDPKTISSSPPRRYHHDHIVIGVVGGLELNGHQRANDTPEQDEAVEELLQALSDALQVPLEITDNREHLRETEAAEEAERTADTTSEAFSTDVASRRGVQPT